jgi:hypothetical protein
MVMAEPVPSDCAIRRLAVSLLDPNTTRQFPAPTTDEPGWTIPSSVTVGVPGAHSDALMFVALGTVAPTTVELDAAPAVEPIEAALASAHASANDSVVQVMLRARAGILTEEVSATRVIP